jgi:hypothetical protein
MCEAMYNNGQQQMILVGISLITHLPIGDNQFVRTAKVPIAEHGGAAIAAIAPIAAICAVGQRIGICKFEGIDSVAKAWRSIREVIRDM